MVLGHEGNSDRFIIDAYDAGVEESEDAGPTVRLWGVRGQLSTFTGEMIKGALKGDLTTDKVSDLMDLK